MTQTTASNSIQINGRKIAADQPTYIIAEIGINHNGDAAMARKLIDVAAEAKVDAIKFQKRHLPSLYREDVLNETRKYEQGFQYMIPILKSVELSDADFIELKDYSEHKGLEFLCTPFDPHSADFLAGLNLNAFKIASADLTNLQLLAHVAAMGKPMLVSTGMSYWAEIEQAVALLKHCNTSFALMHCRSVYPVWPREVNLKMINRLSCFGCPVGYSGHDIGITIPLVAASMGACVIEKHITLDRKLHGPDHKVSLEPFELKRLVRDIRVADQAMGKGQRFLLRGEILNREIFGKSLMAAQPIAAGTRITRSMIEVKGPGKGIAPNRMDDLIGRRIERDIPQGEFFFYKDIDGSGTPDLSNSFRSRWGLICRFSDAEQMLAFSPKVIEFHLAEKDFELPFTVNGGYTQQLIIHAPEYIGDRLFDLCSRSNEIRTRSVAQLNQTIRLTEKLAPHFKGRPKVVAHAGAMSMNTKLDKDRLKKALAKSLAEMQSSPAEILLENLPPYPWYFGGQWKGNYFMDAEEIAAFCRQTDSRICFDLSHAALYCNAKEVDLGRYIATVMPFIGHIHFADAYGLDGEGVQIGEGDIDFDTIMPLFADYTDTWVPEIWRGHLEDGSGFMTALMRLKAYNL